MLSVECFQMPYILNPLFCILPSAISLIHGYKFAGALPLTGLAYFFKDAASLILPALSTALMEMMSGLIFYQTSTMSFLPGSIFVVQTLVCLILKHPQPRCFTRSRAPGQAHNSAIVFSHDELRFGLRRVGNPWRRRHQGRAGILGADHFAQCRVCRDAFQVIKNFPARPGLSSGNCDLPVNFIRWKFLARLRGIERRAKVSARPCFAPPTSSTARENSAAERSPAIELRRKIIHPAVGQPQPRIGVEIRVSVKPRAPKAGIRAARCQTGPTPNFTHGFTDLMF